MKLSEMRDMSGEVVLITGAAGNIGQVITKSLLELGATVVMVDVDNFRLKEFKDGNEEFIDKIYFIECDLEREESIDLIFNYVKDSLGRLDVLINNAAFVGDSEIEGWVEKFENQSIETWKRALNVNLTASFALSKKFSYLLKSRNNGRIVNISSIYGFLGPDMSMYRDTNMGNPAAYSASKGGLTQLTRWLSTTLAPDIRVNAISPGGIERSQPEKFKHRYISKTPLNRLGTEEDLVGAVLFLSSNMSKYVTGEDIVVDGGYSVI